jgi:hypothetical protein
MSLKSSNGWTASANPADIDIKIFTVINGTKPVKLRCASAVAPLLIAACKEWDAKVEKLEPGEVQGYAFRDVRGGDGTLSNHASGTAVDIFPARHPQGSKSGNLTPEQQSAILDICKKYGLRSGGTYKNAKPDWMHIEVNISSSEVATLVASMKGKP